MTPTTRYLCPLDCGWHHDSRDLPDLAGLSGNTIEEIIRAGVERSTQADETAVREHLESHPLIDWVTEVARLQQELNAKRSACLCTEFLDQIDHPDTAALDAVEEAMGDPELSREELQSLVDDQGLDLYRAQDLIAFVREMCDAADRDGSEVTAARVRSWLAYTGCGGAIVLPDEVPGQVRAALAPDCRWPACLSEADQQLLAEQVGASMLGEATALMPDPRPGCGCVDRGVNCDWRAAQ